MNAYSVLVCNLFLILSTSLGGGWYYSYLIEWECEAYGRLSNLLKALELQSGGIGNQIS